MGFDPTTKPGYVLFNRLGCALPTVEPAIEQGSVVINSTSMLSWQLDSDDVSIPPNGVREVVMCRRVLVDDGLGNEGEDIEWLTPAPGLATLGVSVPEGPVQSGAVRRVTLLRNLTCDEVVVPKDQVLCRNTPVAEDEDELVQFLNNLPEVDRDRRLVSGPSFDADVTRQYLRDNNYSEPHMIGEAPHIMSPRLKPWRIGAWFFITMILLLRSGLPKWYTATDPSVIQRLSAPLVKQEQPSFETPVYEDVTSKEYRIACQDALDEYRYSRYAHLSDEQYAVLRKRVWHWAPQLWIDGAPSSTLSGPVFDVELESGARPVKHALPKYSEEQKKKEAYHVDKAEKLGHLRTPAQHERSEWATRTHTVWKRDDPMGRWICDFRDLNKATVKTPIVIGDSHDIVRSLSLKRWKTMFDAWAGFNQVAATERAKRAMQITTSLGLRQWTVMPFGVTNGPSCFQGIMVDHFTPIKEELATSFNASLDFFFDDGAVGSGDWNSPPEQEEMTFEQHLDALDCVFKRAAKIDLRFKLSKCHFLQYAVPVLGEIAGLGKVSPDPSKTEAIRHWPRPSRVEDVERFLCTLSFFRAHISPHFSDIAKPLRDCMSELHERRAQGKYKKVVRGGDPHITNRHGASDSWPSFWNQDCENAFNKLRSMAADAVNLCAPDLDGASNGTNPFLLFPDACKYGIGAGLFQAAPVSHALKDSWYATLGVPSWSTKAAIDARFHELERLYTKSTRNLSKLQLIKEAHAVLGDVAARRDYDSKIGLEKVHGSRMSLVPLGFFSKSLNETQRNWPTWDRELFAVIAALEHFSSIVSGATVVLATDHLNNTVMNVDLKQPDKILRMLLKIHTKINPVWRFQPGRGQLGDGLSRNPVDRDTVRAEDADAARLPKTLAAAFDMVQRAQQRGGLEVDDCEELTQQFRTMCESRSVSSAVPLHESDVLLNERRFGRTALPKSLSNHFFAPRCGSEVYGVSGVHDYCLQAPVKSSGKSRAPTVIYRLPALCLPDANLSEKDQEKLESYFVRGPETELSNVVPFGGGSINYTITDAYGSGRWLEPFVPGPWNKEVTKRARLTFLDGVLNVCRHAETVKGAIGIGEGALVVLGALDSSVREAAFKERHVDPDEAVTINAHVLNNLHHIVLIYPHMYPHRSYPAFFHHYMPEMCQVNVSELQVSVVVPVDDPMTHSIRECASSVSGCVVTEIIPDHKPVWRHLPEEVYVETLMPHKLPESIVPSNSSLPTLCVEAFSGHSGLSQNFSRFGFAVRAYERCQQTNSGDPLPEGDIGLSENQIALGTKIINKEVYQLHLSPASYTFTAHVFGHPSTRSRECPGGDDTVPQETQANLTFAIALWLFYLCVRHGVFVSLDHPRNSKSWRFKLWTMLFALSDVYQIAFDACAWCQRPHNWMPQQGDVRTNGPTLLATNNPDLCVLYRLCVNEAKHEHEQLQNSFEGGVPVSLLKAAYSPNFCAAYAAAVRSGWLSNHQAVPHLDLPQLWLPDLIKSPNMTEQDVRRLGRTRELPDLPLVHQGVVVQAAVSGGSSSSTGAGAPPPAAPSDGAGGVGSKPVRGRKRRTPDSGPSDPPNLPSDGPAAGDGAPQPGAPAVPTGDYWRETPTSWIRYHLEPRMKLYVPDFESGGPARDSLLPTRSSHMDFISDGKSRVNHDNWLDPHASKTKQRGHWTGRTIFSKAIVADAQDGALVHPATGETIPPASTEALALSVSSLRDELKEAQRHDPKLTQIVGILSNKRPGEFIADSRGPSREVKKARARAAHFKLAEDGVLCGKFEDSSEFLPCVPDTPYLGSGRSKTAPGGMTWKHLFLGAVHNTRASPHLSARDMEAELKKLVFWFPPERLAADCQTWWGRCKHCVSVYSKPKYRPQNQSVIAHKPFHRIQIDLMEIRPEGADGETHILTALDMSTRYPFFRCVRGREHTVVAAALFDIILDAGVVPEIIHSDNEFISVCLEELTSLLGSSQIFSTALRPQSLGADERSHRDIRAGLSVLVDAFIRSNPRDWPKLVRFLESKARHRELVDGITPYMAWHGFAGSSSLASSLKAFTEIPVDMVHTEWLRGIREESDRIEAELSAHWLQQAAQRARKLEEVSLPPPFRDGDLVLCAKPFYERGTGVILPQADGPFIVDRVFDGHTCSLRDAVSGLPYLSGQRISLARLIAFNFPVDYIESRADEPPQGASVHDLATGDYVAVETKLSQNLSIYVCRVKRVFKANCQVEVDVYEVDSSDRYGGWNRRHWTVRTRADGSVETIIVPECEILCVVTLFEGALDDVSLERLAHLGVDVGTVPRRDKSIQPRLV